MRTMNTSFIFDDETKTIRGYFAVYNKPTIIVKDAWGEEIAPSAFVDCLGNDICALYNHEREFVLGTTANGTFTLHSDSQGLYGSIAINEKDTDAMNIYERVKRGDIRGASPCFWQAEYTTRYEGNLLIERITKAELIELSVTAFPAYVDTRIEARTKKFNVKPKKIEWWG